LLKIIVEKEAKSTTLKLEGRLVGTWAQEVERVWRTETAPSKYVQVDLTDVSFIDDRGKRLLAEMYAAGLEVIASTLESRAIVEEIARRRR
jgi:anti-anti-sigma regulatory factor